METEIQTREELINGLNYVKTQIEQILSVTNKQVEIVANFREEKQLISTSDTKSQLKIAFICLYVVFVFDNIIVSIANHTAGYFIASLVCGALVYISYKKGTKKKIQKIFQTIDVSIFVIYMLLCLYIVFTSKITIAIILTLIMIAASIYVVIKAVKKKNEKIAEDNAKIAEYNASVQQEYDETVKELDQLKNDLYTQSGYWYPKDYYSLEAVNFFLTAVQNYKADSIKESVLLFDDTQYKSEMLNSQRAIQRMSEQQLINQDAMIKQLKFANVLNVANLALQIGTIGAINDNTSAVNANTYATKSAASKTVSAINDASSNITNAVDKLRRKIK